MTQKFYSREMSLNEIFANAKKIVDGPYSTGAVCVSSRSIIIATLTDDEIANARPYSPLSFLDGRLYFFVNHYTDGSISRMWGIEATR